MPTTTIDTAAALLAERAEPGRHRRLSDLLACTDATPASVYLADAAAARTADTDRPLYTAYRDILPPRRTPDGPWFADLVVYEPGSLPGGELHRSTGHWNTPAQLEIFQCLTGRILMLTAIEIEGPTGPQVRYQECGPGELAAVPFGAWHLTLVLDGPAAVFNLYTDIPDLAHGGHSSRVAAKQPHLKYAHPPLALTALAEADGYRLSGADELVAAARPARPADWIGTTNLPAFFTEASTAELSALTRRALLARPHVTPSRPC